MNNELEKLKKNYKPYRITKKKNVTILETTSGTFVVKEKENNNLKDNYNYLLSRNFDYFPKLIGEDREDVNVIEYIGEVPMPKEQKALDMMNIVALLHSKTTYFKEISEDKYKEIYENLKSNINYAEAYYNNLYTILVEEVYPSPSHYLLMRNIYKIFEAIAFCNEKLDLWYDEAKESLKERVALIHNNLEVDHFLKGDKDYLISWDKATRDSPILDLVNFYQKEYMDYDFEVLFKSYDNKYPLNSQEKHLLMIIISIPPLIYLDDNDEVKSIKIVREKLDYIFKTESLIKNFYPSNEDIQS